MELKAHSIGGEGPAGQSRPLDRVLAFFDILLARATPVIEGNDALSGSRQVSDNESNTRVKLARMPFDLGHDMARLVPALRLIAEAGVVTSYLMRWSPDRSLQQMSDPILQHLVGRQADRVAGTLGFKKLVDLGIGEGGITPEIQMLHDAPVTRDHRLQPRAPAVSTVDVARPQCASLDIAELVEHKQRMIAGAGEVAVIGAAFLLAVGRAFTRIHVEYDGLRPSPAAHFVDPLTRQIGQRSKVLRPAQPSCLEAAHLAR